MHETRTIIAAGGRLVIPAVIRKELDLNEGEEVILRIESGELHVLSYKKAVKQAQANVRNYNKKNISLKDALLKARKEESDNEK